MIIPKELEQHKRFVLTGVNPQNEKQPYSPITMSPKDWNNPDNLGAYEETMEVVRSGNAMGNAMGIGYVFGGDNGIYGIDFDNVFFADGTLIPEVQEIVAQFASYTEVSMSGNGLHTIVYAPSVDLLGDKGKTILPFPNYPQNERRQMEIYQSGAYIALTGDLYDGSTLDIPDRSKELQTIFSQYNKPKTSTKSAVKVVQYGKTDEEYLSDGLKHDPVLLDLWNGKRPTGNESQDDLSLLNKLAYWCNKNKELMYNSFFNSPYF